MLRRLLITWFVVSFLGYGMALAADAHDHHQVEDQTHVVSDQGTNPDDIDHANNCDHCCHGVSHLLGLSSANTINLAVNLGLLRTPYSASLNSFSPSSILRPPITI